MGSLYVVQAGLELTDSYLPLLGLKGWATITLLWIWGVLKLTEPWHWTQRMSVCSMGLGWSVSGGC